MNRCNVMQKPSLSNAGLKNIAYLIMLIDHFFAVVFTEIIRRYAAAGYETDTLIRIRSAGRAGGRIAFILFAYLIAEGFLHTRSRRNYLLRLMLFALISEVPFDLASSGRAVNYSSQNIFFTLSVSVLVLIVWEWAEENIHMINHPGTKRDAGWYVCITSFRCTQFGTLLIGCAAAYILRAEYKYMGVLLIFTFYILRKKPLSMKIVPAACVMFFGMWSINILRYAEIDTPDFIFRFSMRELYGLFAFIPIALYDGQKGRQLPKAVCYSFYAVQLLLLYGIARMIAMGKLG